MTLLLTADKNNYLMLHLLMSLYVMSPLLSAMSVVIISKVVISIVVVSPKCFQFLANA